MEQCRPCYGLFVLAITDVSSTRGEWLSTVAAEALRELKHRVLAKFAGRLERMTLFGSQASGTARTDSDVDVLVLISGLTAAERALIYDLGAEVYLDTRVRLAPLAMSVDEYQILLKLERSLALDIEREGIPV